MSAHNSLQTSITGPQQCREHLTAKSISGTSACNQHIWEHLQCRKTQSRAEFAVPHWRSVMVPQVSSVKSLWICSLPSCPFLAVPLLTVCDVLRQENPTWKTKQNPARLGHFLTSGIQQKFSYRKLKLEQRTKAKHKCLSFQHLHTIKCNEIQLHPLRFSSLCHISYDKI